MSPRRRGPRVPLVQGAAARALVRRVQDTQHPGGRPLPTSQSASLPRRSLDPPRDAARIPDHRTPQEDADADVRGTRPPVGPPRWTTTFSTSHLRRPELPLWVQIDLDAHLRPTMHDRTDATIRTANIFITWLLRHARTDGIRIDITDSTLLVRAHGTPDEAASARHLDSTHPPAPAASLAVTHGTYLTPGTEDNQHQVRWAAVALHPGRQTTRPRDRE